MKQRLSRSTVFRPLQSRMGFVFPCVDALAICGFIAFLCFLFRVPWSREYRLLSVWAALLFVLFAGYVDLYLSWRGSPIRRQAGTILAAWLPMLLGLLLAGYAIKISAFYSRRVLLTWMVLGPLVLIFWRVLLRGLLGWLRRRGLNLKRVAIAGCTPTGQRIARLIADSPWMGLEFIGFYDDAAVSTNTSLPPVSGTLDELVATASAGRVQWVYIALPLREEERISRLAVQLADTAAAVYFVPDLFVFNLLHARLFSFGDLPVVSLFDNPFYEAAGWLKRGEDLLLSLLLLPFFLPIMGGIALLIRLDSGGPIFFVQHRYGLDGREIPVLKFRSMTVQEDGAVVQAVRGDPRVTRVGRWLRRFSLDELPQIFNVLAGQMSLVGPRPHAVAQNEYYRRVIPGYMLRHRVKPGITGWAQVNGWRGETDIEEKMAQRLEYDLDYIRNWSLWLDVKILVLTLWRLFSDPNAY